MRVHVRHEWGSWNGLEYELFREIRKRYEYVPHHRMYDTDVYITWQDVMGNEALGAKVRNIPLIVVQHGAHAFLDYLPEISYPAIADHYCAWGEEDAEWLRMAGVDDSRIEITGSPGINAIHERDREEDRKFWLDFAGLTDRPVILYGPDHATHVGTYDKNMHVMEELVKLSQREFKDCLFIVKIYKEGIQGYRQFLQKEGSADPYDWLEDLGKILKREPPAWLDTIEGRKFVTHGGLAAYRGMGDLPNFIFTCGHWFPQEMLFSAADLCITGNVATFAVKAFSNDIPVIVPKPHLKREDTHSFQVHGKKPYFLYTENAMELDAIDAPEIPDLNTAIQARLKEPEVHQEGRAEYARLHAGPKEGAVDNIINIIERYNK